MTTARKHNWNLRIFAAFEFYPITDPQPKGADGLYASGGPVSPWMVYPPLAGKSAPPGTLEQETTISPIGKKFIIFDKNILAMKQMDYTAIIEKSEDGYYVGQVQEIPEAIAQGKTIVELNQNLLDALQLVIDYRRKHTISQYKGHKIIRRKLNFV